jgi:hypothetical protein
MRNGYLGDILMPKKKAKKVIRKNEVTVTLKPGNNTNIDFYSIQQLPDMKHWK